MSRVERESPLFASECSCGFWRVDQRVFISTQVHIWRQKEKPSKRKKLLGLVLKLYPPADGCNYFGLFLPLNNWLSVNQPFFR